MQIRTSIAGPVGLATLPTIDGYVYNRTGGAVVAGTVYQLDMASSATEVTVNDTAGSDSVWGNIVGVTASGANAYPLCVILTGGAENAKVKVRFQGIVDCFVEKAGAGTNQTEGDVLDATASQVNLNADAVTAGTTKRAVGIMAATSTAGTGAQEKLSIHFCGLGGGMGVKQA